MNISFFCDESGNTGVDMINKNQPFFIIGGWLDVNNRLEDELFRKEIYKILDESYEIKSTFLMKNEDGRRKARKLIQIMNANHIRASVCIVQKRFAVAARIIDVLLDPIYNSIVPRQITYDEMYISKRQIAEIMYKLPDYVLKEFAEAYRSLEYAKMLGCIDKIVSYLQTYGELELAMWVLNSKVLIKNNLEDEKGCKKYQAPNIFALRMLFDLLNKYSKKNNIYIDFVHDKQIEFSKFINEMNNALLHRRDDKIRYRFKKRDVFVSSISNFKFNDSKDNLGIQCADILVGSINYTLKQLYLNKSIDDSTNDLFSAINTVTSDELSCYMISYLTYKKLYNKGNGWFQNVL